MNQLLSLLLLLVPVLGFSQAALTVPLRHSTITFERSIDPFQPLNVQWAEQPAIAGKRYVWLHVSSDLTTGQLEQISGSRIQLLGFVPPHTYFASIPIDIRDNPLASLPVDRWAEVLPRHRISSDLMVYLDQVEPSTERVRVTLRFPSDLTSDRVQNALTQRGFRQVDIPAGGSEVYLTVPAHRIRELAEWPFVQYLEITPPEGETEDQYGRAMHRSNLLINPLSGPEFQLDGSGVGVLVRDDGQIGPHIDFHGRLDQSYCYRPPTDGTHGDMVAGIMAGAGNLLPFVQGMASGSSLFTEDYRANFLGQTMDIVNNEGVVITNSSYSDGCNDGYTNRTVNVDLQIYENPQLMHVFSAGNAGASDCGYGAGPFWGNITGGHKAGKNSIATANLFSDYSLVSSSSRGPVFDGRIKPDIAANGQNQLSTYPNHTIDLGGGTSAAAPGIAGILAQLTQGYRQLNNNDPAPSALLKGALLTTASDLGNPGPDFIYGWGHVNAYQAYQLLKEERFQAIAINPSQIKSFTIDVPSNTAEARFMIYWPDPPAMPQASKALINDLELRVYAPGSSDALLPLVLDATPDPAKLNLPAQPGEDHVNNMEQVRFENPESGSYTIEIEGLTLPFGEVSAYLLWEFRTADPMLVYPAGGESFEPGATNRVYWECVRDVGTWDIELSLDSGLTWVPLANDLPALARFANITYPDTTTNQGFIRVVRDGISVSHSHPFHLLASPQNLSIAKACPDSITYTWSAVDGADGYDLFTLGTTRMVPSYSTDTTRITIPTWNPLAENWVAVRSVIDGHTMSERSRAYSYSNGLLGCKQNRDMRPGGIISPSVLKVQSCEPTALNLIMSFRNDGLTAASNVPVSYQVGQEQPVNDTISGTIQPGANRLFKFDNGPLITNSGLVPLSIWTNLDQDDFRYNDTLTVLIDASILNTGVLTPDHLESFTLADLPSEWRIDNPDDQAGWLIIGLDSGTPDSNYTLMMPNFFNPDNGAVDILTTPLIDLTTANQPVCKFDLSYSGIVGLGLDTLILEISTDCGESVDQVVYAKTGADLITIQDPANIDDSWVPLLPEDWREESIDLSPYAGQKILIRFVNYSGYGNNLWIDNFRIIEEMPDPLQAGFQTATDSVCVLSPVLISENSTGTPLSYEWHFGQDAIPETSSTAGAQSVTYSTSGWKTIELIVRSGTDADTTTRMIYIKPLPLASFDWGLSGDTLYLSSTSAYSSAQAWWTDSQLVGTGQTQFVVNPPSEIEVTLIAENECGSDTIMTLIQTTSIALPDDGWKTIYLTPNPNAGSCQLIGKGNPGQIYAEVIDLNGRVYWQARIQGQTGPWSYPLQLENLPSGPYLLRLGQSTRVRTLPFQIH